MTLLEFVAFFLGAVLFAELTLQVVVRIYRRCFPWLITRRDEVPQIDDFLIRKYSRGSHHPILGWAKRPNSEGTEPGQYGPVSFHIGSLGERVGLGDHLPTAAAFGDSYVFGRQVEDEETWQSQYYRLSGLGMLNFGTGNYGADQGLLRYKITELPPTVDRVLLGFVPETISRVQSVWKHYLEFGNHLAFKPRYVIDEKDGLKLIENPLQDPFELRNLRALALRAQKHDPFYYSRFRNLQFRNMFIASFIRNANRHFRVILALLLRSAFRSVNKGSLAHENAPFQEVMRHNLIEADKLYRDPQSTELLRRILLEFLRTAGSRGHKPLVVVFPQLLDLKLGLEGYREFFRELSKSVPVLDLTEILGQDGYESYYVADGYGGHLSSAGNLAVAQALWSENPWTSLR